jgi:hypothetical protein
MYATTAKELSPWSAAEAKRAAPEPAAAAAAEQKQAS